MGAGHEDGSGQGKAGILRQRDGLRARSVSPPSWLACIRHAMRLLSHARFPDRVSSPQTSANFARSSLTVIRCSLSTNNTNSHECTQRNWFLNGWSCLFGFVKIRLIRGYTPNNAVSGSGPLGTLNRADH
jgi:hypothetical protein